MTITLKTLTEHDTVKFAIGGEAVVATVWRGDAGLLPYKISFRGYEGEDEWYSENGGADGCPMIDIVEIIPAAFDWKDVRRGMGFVTECGTVVNYATEAFGRPQTAVFRYEDDGDDYAAWFKSHLTRAPEHDLPVEDE